MPFIPPDQLATGITIASFASSLIRIFKHGLKYPVNLIHTHGLAVKRINEVDIAEIAGPVHFLRGSMPIPHVAYAEHMNLQHVTEDDHVPALKPSPTLFTAIPVKSEPLDLWRDKTQALNSGSAYGHGIDVWIQPDILASVLRIVKLVSPVLLWSISIPEGPNMRIVAGGEFQRCEVPRSVAISEHESQKGSTVFAARASCTGVPLLQWDPATTPDCVEWDNIRENTTCQATLEYWNITPEEFSRWNPSVGLDCAPWHGWTSYRIVDKAKLERFSATAIKTTTTSKTLPASTTSTTLAPSPTVWRHLGCYIQDAQYPVLDESVSPSIAHGGLTVPECNNACYTKGYEFAGVQGGNLGFCGSFVGGEWTSNQADCNTPCIGDTKSFCGGTNLINAFRAEDNSDSAPSTTSTLSLMTAATTAGMSAGTAGDSTTSNSIAQVTQTAVSNSSASRRLGSIFS